ncbi:biotin carboxyl carrier protein [Bradyrhizobium sp. S3.14.4]
MDAALPRDAAFPPHPESSAEAWADAADAVACSSPTEAAAHATSDRAANDGEASRQATLLTRSLRKAAGRSMAGVGKHFATLAIALVAILISVATWQHYVTAPWTRNGSVRVQVANVAPQIAGKIVELRVADNQFVHKGDVLYVIDPFDFDVAVRIGKALVDQRAADLEVKQAESDRRRRLSDLATTPEEQQIFAGNASQAKAAYAAAAHQLAQAELNLKRTNVLSPVDGYVTNLLLRVGDYALTGVTNVSIIDSNSFWIDGYFEETKMAHVCVGDRVEAQLIGLLQADPGTCENRDPRHQPVKRRGGHARSAQRGPDLHLGAACTAHTGSGRHRHGAAGRAVGLRHDGHGDDPAAQCGRSPDLASSAPHDLRGPNV